MIIISNYQPREVVFGASLTEKEKKEFDYIDWEDVNETLHPFIRYRNTLYDLNEFQCIQDKLLGKYWDGVLSETYFSGILVKCVNGWYEIIVGRYGN